MKHLLLALFVVFSANLFTACSSNDDNNVPQIGEHSAEFKIFMEKKKAGLPILKDRKLGLIPSPINNGHLLDQKIELKNKLAVKNAADPAYDLRDHERVTSVKNQGDCGSCWSFAAMSSLESIFKPGENNDFSENNLKNLHGFDWGPCDGGNSDMAAAYFMRWNGPVNEVDDNYGQYDNTSPELDPVKHVTGYYSVSSASLTSIKEAIVEFGAVDADMFWDDGNFNTTNNAYYYSGSSDINHGISIVGWDDSYSKTNFNTIPANDGAWIIKNSWGTSWGDEGYFYISYEDTKIASNCHVFKATDIEYENLYSYDPFGRTGWAGYTGQTDAWIANVFTAGGDETIKAVSFYANSHATAYEIRIYSGVTTNPTTGATLETTQTGTAVNSGYNSVVLDSPVDLSSGTKFSVVVKVTTPGNENPIPLEMPSPGYASPTASAGQSFTSSVSGADPTGWSDLTGWSLNSNVNIKAYTVDQTGSEDPDTDDADTIDADSETPDDTAEVIDLVINEIDYDQPFTDTAEFIELYNKGDDISSLSGILIQLINGTGGGAALYNTINLPDVSLAAGDYYVICANSATVANCDLDVSPETNLVQNGAPDAMALYNGAVMIDIVSYEGDVPGYTETSGAVEDPSGTYNVGLSRYPDGTDTNDNSSDFSVKCITPGVANSSSSSGCLCGNGTVDPGEDCEPSEGDCCSSTCDFKTSDTVCNEATQPCEEDAKCAGNSSVCPVNPFKDSSFKCATATELCENDSYCSGSDYACPDTTAKPSSFECRESAGDCDVAEFCDGTNKTCPDNNYISSGTICRVATQPCEEDAKCAGNSSVCPVNPFKDSSFKCATATELCENDSYCSGSDYACPDTTAKPSSFECRESAGDCDVAEFCNGTNKTCPADEFAGSEIECRESAGECDVAETCSGSSADCPADDMVADGGSCVGDGYPWTEYKCYSGVCEAGDELYGSCVAPNEITVFPFSDTQDTTGRPDHIVTYGTGCDQIKASGSDVVYELHVKVGFTYTITLNSTEDMAFALLNACGDNEACIKAVDGNTGGEESVELVPETDTVYALIVETVGSTGEYTLTVTETEVEIPDEVEDTDSVDDQETVDEDEIVDEMEDGDDAEVEDLVDEGDPVDNDAEIDAETADKADDAEIDDQSEVSDVSDTPDEVSDQSEVSDNSDATPLNDEDGDYTLEGEGCSCSLII